MRILYLEDNPADADLVTRALRRQDRGYAVDVAPTLAEAHRRLEDPDRYDLVLADLHLPDGSGLDLVREVRKRRLPLACVLLTSQGDETTAVAALKAGADDYQPKRQHFPEEIGATLDAALARFRREHARRQGTLRVLYAEHHPADVDLTLRHLAEHAPHLQCEVVTSAAEVLCRLPTAPGDDPPFDVLLLDYRLPGDTALDLLKTLRVERRLTLPVVVVTGQGDEDVATHALRLGATDYLVKHAHYLHQLPVTLESAHYQAALVREHEMLQQSEARLRDSQALLAIASRTANLGGWTFDPHSARMRWSDEVCRLYGVPPGTRPSLDEALAFCAPDSSMRLSQLFAACLAEGVPFDEEVEIVTGDERRIWARCIGTAVRDSGGHVVQMQGALQDISEKKEAAIARREAERRLLQQASLLDKAQDAIVVRDLDHRVTYWNRSAERLYGWPADLAVGQSVCDLIYRDTTAFEEAMQVVLARGEWVGQIAQVDRGGHPLTVEGRWTLVRDDEGQPQTVLAINTDISERKRLEAQFLRAQRMESLGTLAGGIAHDLNNVLAPILLSIELLRSDEADVERLTLLSTIEASAKRGADMVSQVLSFARGMDGRRADVAVGGLLHDLQRFANETFLKSIEVHTVVPSDLWSVSGDPTQLHQLLLNLCVNARDAMPEGGMLTLTAANVHLDETHVALEPGTRSGPHVRLEVRDSGTGIAPEVVDRMFEPFFTTKELGKGTGLGLSTSLAIVKSHGGFVRVESEPGRGTTFTVFLPAAGGVTQTPPPLERLTLPKGDGERILVVDDEDAVREITRRTLEASGYAVVAAGGGAEAVALCVRHRDDLSAVLIDMMMPVMDGPATIRAIRELHPEVPIIAVTGLAGSRRAGVAPLQDVALLLHKPYTAESLLTGVAHVLHRGGRQTERP